MIKIDELGNTEFSGHASELLADIVCITRSVYRTIKEDDAEIAEYFKESFEDAFKDNMFFMPEDELYKLIGCKASNEEDDEYIKSQINKNISELIGLVLESEDKEFVTKFLDNISACINKLSGDTCPEKNK